MSHLEVLPYPVLPGLSRAAAPRRRCLPRLPGALAHPQGTSAGPQRGGIKVACRAGQPGGLPPAPGDNGRGGAANSCCRRLRSTLRAR